MTDVAPPATDVWWDPAETLASVLLQLRLLDGDVDEDRVAACIAAAGALINEYLDRVDDLDQPSPAQLQAAIEHVAIDLYHGLVGDPIGAIAAQLSGSKQRWGVA